MKLVKYFIIYFFLIFATSTNAEQNFFENAKNLYEKGSGYEKTNKQSI